MAKKARSSSAALLRVLEAGHGILTGDGGILGLRHVGGILEMTPARARRHGIGIVNAMPAPHGGENAAAVHQVLTATSPVAPRQRLRLLEDETTMIETAEGGLTTTVNAIGEEMTRTAIDAAVDATTMIGHRAEGMTIAGSRRGMMTGRNLWRLIGMCLVAAAVGRMRMWRSRGGGRGVGAGTEIEVAIVTARGRDIGSGVVRRRGIGRGRVMGSARRRGAARASSSWLLFWPLAFLAVCLCS